MRSGDLLSAWVPWLVQRAGATRTWSAPDVGEQCLLMSPGGDTAAAVAVVGIYSSAHAAPDNAPPLHTTHYPDGAVISYDQASHALTATLPDNSSATLTASHVTINAPEGATINANLALNGNLTQNGSQTVSGDVVASGISLVHHTHGGVEPGMASTDEPQ